MFKSSSTVLSYHRYRSFICNHVCTFFIFEFYAFVCIFKCMHTHRHVHARTHALTHTHTHTHTHAHTQAHAHAHTHMHCVSDATYVYVLCVYHAGWDLTYLVVLRGFAVSSSWFIVFLMAACVALQIRK